MRILTEGELTYRATDDKEKRLANQAFLKRIYITEEETTEISLGEPFAGLVSNNAPGSGSTTTTNVP
ncbi:hypothetical protein U6G28_00420 [Actinomycetaceae bacterium MB13-C1-2]|nr:hypothetical protein U6G28_00420 [Actinomycetaceae bacterium MB13-C1-2]